MKRIGLWMVALAIAPAMAGIAAIDDPCEITIDGRANAGEVTVGGDGAISIVSVKPVSWVRLVWPARFNGADKAMGGAWERLYGDVGWFEIAATNQPHAGFMPWYFLVTSGKRTDGYGVMTQPNVFACWQVSTNRIVLTLDCRAGSNPVRLNGRRLEACRVVKRRGAEGESAFDAGRAFCRVMCPRSRLPKTPIVGYNDWYCAYGKNTATNFLADAGFVCSLVKPGGVRPYVVADDGWQLIPGIDPIAEEGMWSTNNVRWGMAMPEFAARIKALNAHPGLWYRPLLPNTGKGHLPIDPTDPKWKRQIRRELRRFVDWGMEMVKIDFITRDWCDGYGYRMSDSPVFKSIPAWRDETRTSAEVIGELYRFMRDVAGDDLLIIGCNALDHFAAGLFELQRIGDDTSGKEWARTRKMGPNALAMRAIHNGIFYLNDGDCMGLAAAGAIDWRLNLRWLDLLSRSGTATFVSWKRELATEEIRRDLTDALNRASLVQPLSRPLDWQVRLVPTVWSFGGWEMHYDWE